MVVKAPIVLTAILPIQTDVGVRTGHVLTFVSSVLGLHVSPASLDFVLVPMERVSIKGGAKLVVYIAVSIRIIVICSIARVITNTLANPPIIYFV